MNVIQAARPSVRWKACALTPFAHVLLTYAQHEYQIGHPERANPTIHIRTATEAVLLLFLRQLGAMIEVFARLLRVKRLKYWESSVRDRHEMVVHFRRSSTTSPSGPQAAVAIVSGPRGPVVMDDFTLASPSLIITAPPLWLIRAIDEDDESRRDVT